MQTSSPEIKSLIQMTPIDYLIEMKVAPTAAVLTPQEGIAFTERYVLPTLVACEQLVAAGKIVAGGTTLGAMGFAFIARAEFPQQLEDIVGSLPIWPRAQTTVMPLGTFEARAATVRQRLASNQAAARESRE